MSLGYFVVNNGHAQQGPTLSALGNGSNSLALAGSASMQEDIGKGVAKFVSVALVDAVQIAVPVIGSALSAIEGWVLGQLTDVAFENRDGVVAAELRAMMGRDLYALTGNGHHPLTVTTTHQ